MNLANELLKEFSKATVAEEKKKEEYAYGTARVDESGVFVQLDGSDIFTPAQNTMDVKTGDRVSVLIKNHSAMITGNISVPADASKTLAQAAYDSARSAATSANQARESAATALEKANEAIESAETAQNAADSAVADAGRALTAAQTAETNAANAVASAGRAETAAGTAETNAAAAVASAGRAETAAQTADNKAEAATQSANEAKASATIANETANGAVTSLGIVQNVVDALETDMDDMQTHVAMMDAIVDPQTGETIVPAGLHVVPTSSGYFIVISNDGMYVYDPQSVLVATFGENINFNSYRPQRIGGENAYIEYYDSDNDGQADSLRIVGASVVFSSGETLEKRIADASTLLYDHTYSISNGIATFTALLWEGKEDVKTSYEPQQFTWYYKNENQEQEQPLLKNLVDGVYVNYGYTISVPLNEMGYGTHIIGKFTKNTDTQLLTENDDTLTNSQNQPITGRTESGESVRVSDLSVATTLYGSEKLMVVGAEDEHLITVQTLQDYLNANLNKQVLFNTTAGWNSQVTLVSDPNTLYVYTDHQRDAQGNTVAGIKAGDGNAYVVDLPFTDTVATEHIADTTRHITAAERAAWNNHMSNSTVHITAAERAAWNEKVRCYYAGTEQLVFTTT